MCMRTLQILIATFIFSQTSSGFSQILSHSLTDLYERTNHVYNLSRQGKSLAVMSLCDSLIQSYQEFQGSERYFGYLYVYMAEAAKQQGDISLSRQSYELAKRYFPDCDEMNTCKIPVNLIYLDLDAGRFTQCIDRGLVLMNSNDIIQDPSKLGVLLNNLTAAAIQSQNYELADSLFQILLGIRDKSVNGSDFDIALSYRNFGLFKLATGNLQVAKMAIQTSIKKYEDRAGSSHFQIAKSWHALGNLYIQLNDYDSACYCYDYSEKIFMDGSGMSSEEGKNEFSLDYETLYMTLLVDEIDLQRKIALSYEGDLRNSKLLTVSDKAALGIEHFVSLQKELISSESGFILADKLRQLIDAAILVKLDLYKETNSDLYLRQALILAMQSSSVSLTAKAALEERMLDNDSLRITTLNLYQIRNNIEKADDRKVKSKLIQEYLTARKLLSNVDLKVVLPESLEKESVRLIKAVGHRQFLCYHQIDTLLLVFRVSQSNISVSKIIVIGALSQQVSEFKKMLSSPRQGNYTSEEFQEYARSGFSLYNLLLMPFVDVGSSKDLLIKSDGILLDLPLEALVMDFSDDWEGTSNPEFRDLPFVVKNFNISYIFGTRPVKKARNIVNRKRSLSLLFCLNDSLAPEITLESRSLANSKWKIKTINLGEESLDLKKLICEAEILHFSGHVILNQLDPNLTILGCANSPERVFHISELLHMRINQQLTYINGCESAGGMMNHGEGRLSPGLYFLLAGSQGVIDHIWKAPDLSALTIAVEFYQNYKGKDPAKALSESKLEFIITSQPGRDHPHYWAGCIYSGQRIVVQKDDNIILTFIFIGIMVVLIAVILKMNRHS